LHASIAQFGHFGFRDYYRSFLKYVAFITLALTLAITHAITHAITRAITRARAVLGIIRDYFLKYEYRLLKLF
jgi:hypothetical protein